MGGLTLTPAFSADWVLYTSSTEDATNTITATTGLAGATVAIDVDGTPVDSGDPASWEEGVNHVTITVTEPGVGGEVGIYRVDVTYTET